MKLLLLLILFFGKCVYAKDVIKYQLTIEQKNVNLTGKSVNAMTINDSIPGPTLTFTEGDTAEIEVVNKMKTETSIHWHGLILPNFQDGVPYLTTPPILPGEKFTYRFSLKHAGTYWYHSHTGLQEQIGVYGSIVIKPKKQKIKYDRDLVLVLSDWTNENPDEVLRTLKRGSDWYSIKKKTAVSVTEAIAAGALDGLLNLWKMRMPGIDISDVYYDTFLINGKNKIIYPELKPGKVIRLRVVNAAASTYFWTTIGDTKAKLISADGADVRPVSVPQVLHAIAETYDYLITIPKDGSIEFRAQAQDGSGFVTAILGQGKSHMAKRIKPPDYIQKTKMASEMSMNHEMNMATDSNMDHEITHKNMMDHAGSKMKNMKPTMDNFSYSYDVLMANKKTTISGKHDIKNITLNLTGNMWRYVWSLNGKTLSEADKIKIKRGETVRVVLNNKTMMNHPMHLHGHFFRVLNKNGEFSPLKHTVDVGPMSSVTIEFPAKESGDWFFHCHILYHMKGGMARVFSYGDKRDERLKKFALSNILDMDTHWYTWTKTQAASHFSSFEIMSTNTRNQLNLGAQYGWNKNLEADFSYDRFLSDYFRVYIGANSDNKVEKELGPVGTVGTIGMKWLLPYFIDSNLRLDTDLNIQLSFNVDYLLFPKTSFFAYWEMTNDFGWRNNLHQGRNRVTEYVWNSGLEYILSKNLSLFASYDSRFGGGGGLAYIW